MSSRGTARKLNLSGVRKLHGGWIVLIAALLLTALGIETISTTKPDIATNQFEFGCIGFVVAFGIAFIPIRRIRQSSWWLFAGGLLLLIFLLLPGVPDSIVKPRHGARRWIDLGVSVQPSELVKIVFVLAIATHLRFQKHYRSFLGLAVALCVALPPMMLILFEPDLGTAMLFLPAMIAMLVTAGARYRHMLVIGLFATVCAVSVYPVLESHQQDRILALIAQIQNDTKYEQTIGYQGARAMTLVGAGQFAGVGKEPAAQLLQANHLPEEHNDMIFVVICLRWGLFGAIGTWLLYCLLGIGGAIAAMGCKDPFPRLVAVGLTAVFLSQMLINTAMTIGLAPITGLTLPFVSAGGSSLVSAWLMVGLLFGIAMRRDPFMTREGFAFEDERG